MQLRFVDEYLSNPSNIKEAALRAGYSETNAPYYGSTLLRDPRIRKLIKERQSDAVEGLGINELRILKELHDIAFANVTDIVSQDDLGNTVIKLANLKKADAAGIAEVVITTDRLGTQVAKIRMADKQPALEKLGKYLLMFKDKLEISGNVNLLQLVEASIVHKIEQPELPVIEADYTEVTLEAPQLELFQEAEL